MIKALDENSLLGHQVVSAREKCGFSGTFGEFQVLDTLNTLFECDVFFSFDKRYFGSCRWCMWLLFPLTGVRSFPQSRPFSLICTLARSVACLDFRWFCMFCVLALYFVSSIGALPSPRSFPYSDVVTLSHGSFPVLLFCSL